MPIIFSTISALRPDGARVFFQAPDDALLANVVAEVASILGRHQAYMFHEPHEVPAGLVPVVLNLNPGLRKPVAETLDELQDYLKEAGDTPRSKSKGVI